MTSDTLASIYNDFVKIVEQGDPKKAMAYIKEHWNNFPEALQEELTMVFFEDAVKKEAKAAEAVATLQKEGVETIGALEKMKRSLEDALKAETIRDGLK